MKKLQFVFAAAAAVLSASCQKGTVNYENSVMQESGKVELILEVPVNPTKATSVTSSMESALHSVQYFVFSEGSTTDRTKNPVESVYVTPSGGSGSVYPVTISVTGGNKIIRAVVNCPEFQNIQTEADLDARQLVLPKFIENGSTKNGLMMNGRHLVNVNSGTGLDKIAEGRFSATIHVQRLVSKISIAKVTPALRSDYYAGQRFTVKNIWLVNAPADTKMQGGYTPTQLRNRNKVMETDSPITGDAVNMVISSGSSYNVEHSFYCFPGTEASRVLLCVETLIGNTTYYYSIDIAKNLSSVSRLEANKSYKVSELKILSLGTDDPEKVVEKDAVEISSIEVDDWATDMSYPYIEEI